MNIKKNNHLIIPETQIKDKMVKGTTILRKKIYNKPLLNRKSVEIKYLYKKPIVVSCNDVIKLYGVDSIDRLILYINETLDNNSIIYYDSINNEEYKSNDNINEIPFGTVNKVFNSWIYENFSILKTHNKILNDLCYKLLTLTLPNDFMTDELFKKNIKDYISYWFEEKNNDDFNFDLISDMNIYFYKKFRK